MEFVGSAHDALQGCFYTVEWKGVIWSPVQCWSAREGGYMGRSMGALVPALYCLPTLPDDEHAAGDGDGGDGERTPDSFLSCACLVYD